MPRAPSGDPPIEIGTPPNRNVSHRRNPEAPFRIKNRETTRRPLVAGSRFVSEVRSLSDARIVAGARIVA
jgi:hypothetical protein